MFSVLQEQISVVTVLGRPSGAIATCSYDFVDSFGNPGYTFGLTVTGSGTTATFSSVSAPAWYDADFFDPLLLASKQSVLGSSEPIAVCPVSWTDNDSKVYTLQGHTLAGRGTGLFDLVPVVYVGGGALVLIALAFLSVFLVLRLLDSRRREAKVAVRDAYVRRYVLGNRAGSPIINGAFEYYRRRR